MAPLLLGVTANPRQLGGRVVLERPVGLNLIAEESQKLGEVRDPVRE